MVTIHLLLPKRKQLNWSGMLNALDMHEEQVIQEQLARKEFLPT